jgi:hypothetical protein
MSAMRIEWDDSLEDDSDLEEITRRFLPETVVWTTDWTTGSLIDQMEREIFDVDPPFQRRNAWNDAKASLYIESLLLGCPVPPITLAEMPPGRKTTAQYIVIDGKQRLSSIKRFALDGNLTLKNLGILKELNDKNIRDLRVIPEYARFVNLPIRTVVLRNWHKDEVLQFIFNRLNTQSTPLSTQELRRSLLAGPFMTYLDERSANSKPIGRILNIEEPDYRLRDAELLLRGLAFSTSLSRYSGNLKLFLDDFSRQLNRSMSGRGPVTSLEDAANQVDNAIEHTFELFGNSAFQKAEPDGTYTNRFNRAVFDLMVWTFSQDSVRRQTQGHSDEVNAVFLRLCGTELFSRYLTSTTKSKEAVRGRFSLWLEGLESAGITFEPRAIADVKNIQ